MDHGGSEMRQKILEASCKCALGRWAERKSPWWSVGVGWWVFRFALRARDGLDAAPPCEGPDSDEVPDGVMVHAVTKSCTFRGCCAADTFLMCKVSASRLRSHGVRGAEVRDQPCIVGHHLHAAGAWLA